MNHYMLAVAASLIFVAIPASASPPREALRTSTAGRSFTYQGMLRASGSPLNDTCDLQFSLWDAVSGGVQIGATQTVTTAVTDGLFTVLLNGNEEFGASAFDGHARWIEIAVRSPSGSGPYTTLSPRQLLSATPFAAGLTPYSTTIGDQSWVDIPVLKVMAPYQFYDPMAIAGIGGASSSYNATGGAVGVWGDSQDGTGLRGTSDYGIGVSATSGTGWAGWFAGDVYVSGKLQVDRFQTHLVINTLGPLPRSSLPFTTYGGTLILAYSGSGWRNGSPGVIGMDLLLDGSVVDRAQIYANNVNMHLPFVSSHWVLNGVPAGSHTITLQAAPSTSTDYNDKFNVLVTELPF